ncbi:radical SAM family heme chaperone HemW [Alteribacillus iranensis]|uniref:Heme chaperone HemW n=1 Tax=Alteribacillus iranensis TaxID=930128 RepID=A0A1I1ZAR2_9BACI|nr:radical SAM family heme chaperone HemW [Alteribacillus iranensis]SFE28652.1 coproporphyrinogen III oxidase, anaerobic [Alteribacillus iranensis]
MTARAVYVHIPFCTHICYYCDFNKFFIKDQPVDEYIDMLNKEVDEAFKGDEDNHSSLHSIYIGGGTPTALTTAQLRRVIKNVTRHVPDVEKNGFEFTVEVNPGEADVEKLQAMRELGVNRLSIGVQSFDDHLLKKIGRAHTAGEAERTIALAKQAGFTNISIDLMFGLPDQTIQLWEQSIDKAVALDVTHVSAYSLKIEKKTMFYNWYQRGQLNLLSEDTEAEMYDLLMSKLEKAGFSAYEISNFARNGYESKHNKTYWKNEEYYGFGAGAHGYLQSVRYANVGPLPHYIDILKKQTHARKDSHTVTSQEQMEEEMFMGLRMREGVSDRVFKSKYGLSYMEVFGEAVEELTENGLLEKNKEIIYLTDKGRLLGNEVFEKFIMV